MEDWEFDFKWLKTRHWVKDRLQKDALPDLNTVLFLIGIQELGVIKPQFTKEEKQDLMHIAVCRLLSYDGYYELEGIDADGWPHWVPTKKIKINGVKNQERLLKEKAVQYIEEFQEQNLN